MASYTKEQIVQHFHLQKHPEGGYFLESYRSKEKIHPQDGRGLRSASTGIYFLLGTQDKSHLHRIKSDEMWHHYLGKSIIIVEIDEETHEVKQTRLGKDLMNGEVLQYVVPANRWFGAYHANHCLLDSDTQPNEDSYDWSLVGCTVSPGFEFGDFELAERNHLISQFPQHKEIINFLTPPPSPELIHF